MNRFTAAFITSSVMLITPELAREMLGTSPGNRKIRVSRIRILVGAIRRGEWRLTHQGIAFDTKGHLRDGHHRLLAIEAAGVPCQMVVTLGLDPEATEAMDQGWVRSAADVLGLDRRISEVLRLGASIVFSLGSVTVPQIRAFAETGAEETAVDLVTYCGTVRRFFTSAPMKLAAITMATRATSDEERAFVFSQYRALATFDLDSLTPLSQSLIKYESSGIIKANQHIPTLARGLKVFDVSRASGSKLLIKADDLSRAPEVVRHTFLPLLDNWEKETGVSQPKIDALVKNLEDGFGNRSLPLGGVSKNAARMGA